MEKMKDGIFIFIGISIIAAGFFIASSIDTIGDTIVQFEPYPNNSTYDLVVQDGILYMWDTTTGVIWKKNEKEACEWEEVEYFLGY